MSEEQQFQIGDRVVIQASDENNGFYGLVEELRPTHCDVRVYDGRLALWIQNDYLQKVDPYDLKYVMPGDTLRDKECETYKKVAAVQSGYRKYANIITLAPMANGITMDRFERQATLTDLSLQNFEIYQPIGNSDKKMSIQVEGNLGPATNEPKAKLEVGGIKEDEWEEVTVKDLEQGDVYTEKYGTDTYFKVKNELVLSTHLAFFTVANRPPNPEAPISGFVSNQKVNLETKVYRKKLKE